MTTFYTLLGIKVDANNEEINKAFRLKSLEYHPDKNNGSKASEDLFKILNEAKETLLDFNKRLAYDYLIGVRTKIELSNQKKQGYNFWSGFISALVLSFLAFCLVYFIVTRRKSNG